MDNSQSFYTAPNNALSINKSHFRSLAISSILDVSINMSNKYDISVLLEPIKCDFDMCLDGNLKKKLVVF